MPDDGLGIEESGPNLEDDETTQQANAPSYPPEALREAMEQSFGPMLGQVGGALRSMDSRMRAIESSNQPSGDTMPQNTDDTRLDELLKDPDSYVRREAGKFLSEKTGPLFEQMISDRQNQVLVSLQESVDKEFGEGTWETEISTELGSVLERFPVTIKSSEQHIKSAIDGIKGTKLDKLMERKAAVMKARADEQDRSPTGDYSAMRAGRGIPKAGKLNATDKEFIQLIRSRDDKTYTEEDYIRMMTNGNTEETWIPRKEKA